MRLYGVLSKKWGVNRKLVVLNMVQLHFVGVSFELKGLYFNFAQDLKFKSSILYQTSLD